MVAFLRREYSGGGATTALSASMSSSDVTFAIVNATGWPGSPAANFMVVIDRGTPAEEKILCSANASTTVTVATRGYDGTSAAAHSSGATVSLCAGAIDFDETNQVSNLLGNGAEGSLFYGKGAGALPAKLAIGTNNYVLTSNGTDPTWAAASGGITALTGDVTASGSGSQAATLVGTTAVEAIITANATVAAALPKSGGTMSGAIAMGSNKITGLTNGSGAQDGAAFGQVPVVATTVTGPDAYGAAAVVGTGTKWSPNDHSHGLPAAPAASLTSASGVLGVNVSPATSNTKIMDTASLGTGTWFINFTANVQVNAGEGLDIGIAVDGATATFSGVQGVSIKSITGIDATVEQISFSCIATITGAGTIQWLGIATTGGSPFTVLAASQYSGEYSVTGYTELKIA